MKHKWDVDIEKALKGIIKLYDSKNVAFREMIVNSVDAYNKKKGYTGFKSIWLTIPEKGDKSTSTAPRVSCLDHATGIENIQTFHKLFQSEKLGDKVTIGENGIGRAANFSITIKHEGTIYYISNNGDVEITLHVDIDGIDDDTHPVSSNNGRIKRQGCCVIINDVDMDNLSTPKEVIKYLSGVFNLLLYRDPRIKIYVNQVLVSANKELESFKKEYLIYESPTTGVKVVGNIQNYNAGTGSLWLYKKYIRIGSGPKDLGLDYRIKGWINCDTANITPSRGDYSDDAIYTEIKKGVAQYLEKGNYRKIEKEEGDLSPLKSRKLMGKMSELLNSLCTSSAFKDKLNLPQITTQVMKEVEVDAHVVGVGNATKWDDPDVLKALAKAKQAAGIPDAVDSLTGGNGGESGKEVNGFRTDGHTHHIKPGSGGGIQTNATIKSKGDISTISTPTMALAPGGGMVAGAGQTLVVKKVKQKQMVNETTTGGFTFLPMPFGDTRPPYFIRDNIIYCNTTNSIFRAAVGNIIGMAALFAIAVVHLFKDYEEVDSNTRDNYMYEVMRHFLKELGQL